MTSCVFFPHSQLGGTIGDIEGMPFVEAFRQFQFKAKRENFCNIHVSLVPQVSFPDKYVDSKSCRFSCDALFTPPFKSGSRSLSRRARCPAY